MQSVVRIQVTDGPDKLVWLPSEQQPVPMGMHDQLAGHYKATPGTFEPHASTLDYVVGAVGACLTGTFKRALAARGVIIAPADLKSVATGEIVIDGDVPVLRAIEVHYRLSGTHARTTTTRSSEPSLFTTRPAQCREVLKTPSRSAPRSNSTDSQALTRLREGAGRVPSEPV